MLAPVREVGLLEQARVRPTGVGGALLGADDHPVGVVRFSRDHWTNWLLGPTCFVHETDEEPLVFVVEPCWSFWTRWTVYDADGERVGTVGDTVLLGRWDEPCLSWSGDGTFRSVSEVVMGRWDGVELWYAPASSGEPFLRMLMLAAVLMR